MKRRDLFGNALMFGSVSALPLAVASVGEKKVDDPNLMFGDVLYHAVYLFDKGADDFRLAGLWSLESDALAQVERLKNLEHYKLGHICAVGTAQVSQSWVEDFLVSMRLGEMKEVLERIEKLIPRQPA